MSIDYNKPMRYNLYEMMQGGVTPIDAYTKEETDALLQQLQNEKQDVLVNGVNIKSINGNSLLGSGNIEVGGSGAKPFRITYGTTTYDEAIEGLSAGNGYVLVVPASSGLGIRLALDFDTVIYTTLGIDYYSEQFEFTFAHDTRYMWVKLSKSDGWDNFVNYDYRDYTNDKVTELKQYVDTADANLQAQIDAFETEPFRVKNYTLGSMNKEIPFCTEEILNTQIPNIDFTITGQEATDYQIVGMIAYEIMDANNNRINCWPVCQFTQTNQTVLRTRWVCAGNTRKTAAKANCWLLLKKR